MMIYFGKSDIGMHRAINQDSFTVRRVWGERALLLVVCDGMGGHKAGEIASTTAASVFADYISLVPRPETNDPEEFARLTEALLREAVGAANKRVMTLSESDDSMLGMGTTLVSALIDGSDAYIINVGDSRLYKISQSGIKQITKDHSFVQHLIDEGRISVEEARVYPRRNVITHAVGIEEEAGEDIFRETLSPGDALLLCSDGLTTHLTDAEIAAAIADTEPSEETEKALAARVETLIGLANSGGGSDNITALLAMLPHAKKASERT